MGCADMDSCLEIEHSLKKLLPDVSVVTQAVWDETVTYGEDQAA